VSISSWVEGDLAILGGPKVVTEPAPDLFQWPIVTEEDEQAVLDVLRRGAMSGWDVSLQFEREFADWQGRAYGLTFCNGTAALLGAMYACGIGRGDEIISPSQTYWATALPVFSLGGTVVFADADPKTLCIDPSDIEHRITSRTKAIVVVHYCGHPVDMDPVLDIAARHGLKVIEDVSHAQGALYKGRKVGTFGDAAAMSLMSGKSFPIGEGGILVTDDQEIYERAIAFGFYQRHGEYLTLPELETNAGLPLGGFKHRLNQTASAMGRVQLRYYDARITEIQGGMNRFWDLLEGTPGLRAHRPPKDSGSTMGGWYNPVGHYLPEELGGLPSERFAEAVQAEGAFCGRGVNMPLHLHPVFNEADIYQDGKPTRIAFSDRDLRQPPGSLPVTEALSGRVVGVPWFKHDDPERIEAYAAAFRKVALHASELV
jgi:perosamine synthetase